MKTQIGLLHLRFKFLSNKTFGGCIFNFTIALHQFSRFKSFGLRLRWCFSLSVDHKSGKKQHWEAHKKSNEFWKGCCECHIWGQSCSVKEEIKKICWQHRKYSKQKRSALVYSEMSCVSACGWDYYYCILCLCYFSVETQLYRLFCNLLYIYVV